MTYSKAIVIAAGLLAGSVLLSGPATTSEGGKRYAIASGGTAAGDGAWRVDTYTGRMVWCHTTTPKVAAEGPAVLRGSGGRRVVCYDADGKVDVTLF